MNLWSLIICSLFLVVSIVTTIADSRTGYSDAPLTAFEQFLSRCFGFFGIGAIPPLLALSVFMSTGAVSGFALELIANLHLGAAYPYWLPADIAASGLGVGLLCTRLLAISPAPTQFPSDKSGIKPHESGYSF